MLLRSKIILMMIVVCFTLNGCTSDEEKKLTHLSKGKEYFAAKEYKKADIEFRNAIQIDPKMKEAWSNLGETLLKLGKASEAFQAFSKVEALEPDNKNALINLVTFYLLAKQTDKAKEKVDKILAASPKDIEALLLKALILGQENQKDQAGAVYEEILTINPSEVRALQGLSQVKFSQNDFKAAESLLLKAIAAAPENLQPRLALAGHYLATNDRDRAESVLKETAIANPDNSDVQILLGNFNLARSDKAGAEASYKKALEIDPKSLKPYLTLAKFYEMTERTDQALEMYEKAVALNPEDMSVKILLAQFYQKSDKSAEARKVVKEILDIRPKFIPARLMKSEFLVHDKQFAEALKILDALAKEEPKEQRIYYFQGLSYLGLGQMESAKAALVKTLEINPNFMQAHLVLADVFYREKSYDLALHEADLALRQAPDNTRAISIRANAYMKTGKDFEAETGFKTLIEKDPESPEGYYRMAVLRSSQKDYASAQAYLDTALSKNPLLIDVFTLLIRNNALQGNFSNAHDLCRKQLELFADKPYLQAIVHTLDGNLYMTEKNRAKAAQSFEKAIEADPDYLKPYMSLATINLSEKEPAKAAERYLALIAKNPKLPTPYFMLGMLAEADKAYDKAEGYYRKALENKPDFAPAANNLAYLLAERTDKFDEALTYARTAKAKLPNDPGVMDTLGLVYFKKGLYGNAVSEFLDSLEQLPDNATVHYHLGMAYHKKGDKDLAVQELKKALDIDANFDEAEAAKKILKEIQG